MKKMLVLLCVVFAASSFAFAGEVKTSERVDTITLKKGIEIDGTTVTKLEGKILAEGEKAVVIIVGETEKVVPRSNIVKIEHAKDEGPKESYVTENVNGLLTVTQKGAAITPEEPEEEETAKVKVPKQPTKQPGKKRGGKKPGKPTAGKRGEKKAPIATPGKKPGAKQPVELKKAKEKIKKGNFDIEKYKEMLRKRGFDEEKIKQLLKRRGTDAGNFKQLNEVRELLERFGR